MPATLVAKLAPTPARADHRTRTTRQGSPTDDVPDFKQALADARPKVADADRVRSADRPSPDAASAKPKSTGETEKSPQNRKPGHKSEQSTDSPPADAAADPSIAVQTTDDPVGVDSTSQSAIDAVIAADAELPVALVSGEQPAIVLPDDADADPSVSAADHPVALAPDLSIAPAQPPATPESRVTPDLETTTASGTGKTDPPAAQATNIAAPVQPADATAAAKSAVPAAATQAPAADTQPATPQSPLNTTGASADPLVAADTDRDPSAGTDRHPDRDASARHPAGPAQTRAATTAAAAGDTAQPATEFSVKSGDAADTAAADKIVATTADPSARSNAPAAADKAAPAPSPQQAFAQQNHERIVSSVRTQLLPNGGSMQIRLQPGNLGNMQISVRMVDGVMSASFQTSSDEATRLLSHSLSQLKTTLETQGIQVDRIQVTQAPREAQSAQDNQSSDPNRQNPSRQEQQQQAHEENQRRLILNRMWQRMAIGEDPLDLVA